MFLLALDTSTPAVTVALHDGERVVAETTTIDARRHTELLGPAIVDVLNTAGVDRQQLTGIAVGVGPGPFTGLRIGLVTARMLGHVLDIPVHGVCSLDVVARGVAVDGPFVVATDARRKEVYWAAYDDSERRTEGPDVVAPLTVATDLPVAGAGARLYPEAFPNPVPPQFPSATDLAIAVARDEVPVLPAKPIYLRRPDARPPAGRRPVLSQTVRLRPMRRADVELLVGLAQQLFAGDPPWSAEHFESELAGVPDTRWYVVAEANGQLAGYAGLMVSGDTADVQTLAVAPGHQRRRIGTTLLAALIDQARRRGASTLLLEVRADNEAALAFYTQHAFQQISRRRGYYHAGRVDALVLRRDL